MLQDIASDLQAPEMSPGHASGTLTPGRKVNSVVSTLTGNGQLLVTDPLWTCSRSPVGDLCRTSTHLAHGQVLSSTGRQWTCTSPLLHPTTKKQCLFPAMDWGTMALQPGTSFRGNGAVSNTASASLPKFLYIWLFILHNYLGVDSPDFPTRNLDRSTCVHVSVDGLCSSSAAAQGQVEPFNVFSV